MVRSNSQTLALLLVVLALVGTGCLSSIDAQDRVAESTAKTTTPGAREATTTGVPEGDIRAYLVEDVPEEATVVNATDPRIDDVRPIQRVLDRALASKTNSSSIHIQGRTFTEADQALEKLDGYTGTEATAGYYIRKDGRVFAVFIAVYD